MKRKSVEYAPAKRTIQETSGIKVWNLFGFNTAKIQTITYAYPVKKLRGAKVCIVGPSTWKNAKILKGKLVCRNKMLKVRLLLLKEGVKSKKWKVGEWKELPMGQSYSTSSTFNISPKYLKETW